MPTRIRVSDDARELHGLPPAVRHLLETGELAAKGVGGRCDAFLLMKGSPLQRERLAALWRRFRGPLLAEWRRLHQDGSEPWAAGQFEGEADE